MITLLTVGTSSLPAVGTTGESDDRPTTAWHDGALRTDTAGLVSRSDLVQEGPAWHPYEAMPLGNGVLGAAVWAEKGFSAQLNRVDTFPDLKSAGRLVVPGLDPLMRASDYKGRLALYDGQLVQSGGGMTARSYVKADADQFVLEVTGADPGKTQTADLKLWAGRTAAASAIGGVAALAETFHDQASGSITGAVAALTAGGRGVTASVVDPLTVRLTFRPNADGSFRLVVGVPSYRGGELRTAARRAVVESPSHHLDWWHSFWSKAAPMRITSADGSGEYVENLRTFQLYTMAASMRGDVPSTHGAVVRMFSSSEDQADWAQDSYWHFNLRELVAANRGAGIADFNAPYFKFYLDRAELMREWTRTHWTGSEGLCVPEFMRYDGTADGCDNTSPPNYTTRILSSGPELVNNIWEQYRYTGDKAFLDRSYPLMRDVARFYLSALTPSTDGYLHLEHVNALEVQWDTTDPVPDMAAMRVTFPIVADLASSHGDAELADQLRAAVKKLPPFRTVQRGGEDVLAWSGTDEEAHNTQNPEMEALWPWGLYDETSDLMQATFQQRVYPQDKDWGMDATWAARLGLSDQVKALLLKGIADFQIYPNGFTVHRTGQEAVRNHSFYNEWGGVVATGLQESLVQSYDGVVTVAPAWPRDWDVSGSVEIEGGHRISTEVHDGVPSLVGIEAGSRDTLQVRNPWPGQSVRVVDSHGRTVVSPTSAEVVTVNVNAHASYTVERVAVPLSSFHFTPLTGQPAAAVKTLGTRVLGIRASEPPLVSDLVSVQAPEKLSNLVKAQPGAPTYVDRSYTITDLPSQLNGQALVQGANDDSKATTPADYLTLNLTRPATVYVAFDPRGENVWWPDWLGTFTRTDETVGTTDQRLILFTKDVPAGPVILGPNASVPNKGNSTYITFVTPR